MRTRLISILALMSGLAAASATRAADLPAAQPARSPPPLISSGAYSFNLLYTGEAWDDAAGGLKRGGSYMYNIDGAFAVDTGKAFGWTGGTFMFDAFYANGVSTGNSYVGAVDQQSPIDTAANVPMLRLYQVYYDQNFGSTDVRFGIYDLETEFSNTKPMALFLSKNLTWNTAYDQAGTMPENGTIGPGNYPYTPLALRIRQDFGHGFSAQFAVADGAADNPNHLAENGVYFTPAYGAAFLGEGDYTPNKYTKIMLGGWGLTSKLPVIAHMNLDGSQKTAWGEAGGYIGAADRIYAGPDKRGLDAFFTYGASAPRSTNVSQSFNAGLAYTGLLDARPGDKAGVSFNINYASSNQRALLAMQGDASSSYEASFEATYRAKINEYLTIQPDVQYIVRPGFIATRSNALAVGLHFEIGKVFEW